MANEIAIEGVRFPNIGAKVHRNIWANIEPLPGQEKPLGAGCNQVSLRGWHMALYVSDDWKRVTCKKCLGLRAKGQLD